MPKTNSDKTIEPSNALKKPSTSNPGTIQPANLNNKAFIINEKSPKVIRFTGKEINCNIGFTNVFINAITTDTSIAVRKLAILIPGISHATNIIAKENAIHLKNILTINYSFLIENYITNILTVLIYNRNYGDIAKIVSS